LILLKHVEILLTMTPPSLSDVEYQRLVSLALSAIEAQLDAWLDADVIDIDSHRTGGLLEMTFLNGSKIIVNAQPPLHELWLAARAGGFHFRWEGEQWKDTRDGSEFFACLFRHASDQGQLELRFIPPVG
jgi:CyaY protein